jgi:hypothetical protein
LHVDDLPARRRVIDASPALDVQAEVEPGPHRVRAVTVAFAKGAATPAPAMSMRGLAKVMSTRATARSQGVNPTAYATE